jgi:oligopeptide/dipeptide ABC transporter ATP-binding protein
MTLDQRPGGRDSTVMPAPLVAVAGLVKHFPQRGGWLSRVHGVVRAVDDVGFTIARGQVLGLVGESGSGKTTVGRLVLRLLDATSGRVSFDGTDLAQLDRRALRRFRKRMQIIFQDPYASLNPRESVRAMLTHAQALHGLGTAGDRPARAAALLDRVGLSAEVLDRYPHEFSGGQRQRLVIARALAVEPEFLVADEPVSALDVSIQAQVVNLLADLRDELGLTMLFIAHDLAVVEHLADHVAVMFLGRVMEMAPKAALFARPAHPYTQALLAAVPVAVPGRRRPRAVLAGEVPSPLDPPSGCVFRTRCPRAEAICADERPALAAVGADHVSACHFGR